MCSLILLCFFLLCVSPNLALLTSSSVLHNSSSVHLCHEDESSALLHFLKPFTIIDDPVQYPYNNKTRSWKEGTDCCEWEGIICHPLTHHVISLDLSFSGIKGTIESNSSIFLLRHLKHLDLSSNDFTGEIPIQLGQLSHLKSLDLSYNVHLEMTTFKMIIENLTSIRALTLDQVMITTVVPQSITNLSSLAYLFLEDCNLRGPLPMKILHLPHLKSLSIGHNDGLFSDSPLSNWSSSLEVLDLSWVNLSTSLPSSPGQQHLRELYLDNCSIHGSIPTWVWNVSDSITLQDNELNGNISLNILSKLPKLWGLSLSRSGLSVIIPDEHMNLTSTWPQALSVLDLSNCNIQGKFPTWIHKIWKDSLVILDLSHNSLTGTLSNFSGKLELIDISNNMLEGPPPIPSIATQYFVASNNKFTGPIPASTCNLTDLLILDLSNNRLSGDFPHCLGSARNSFLVLDFNSNNIHGNLPNNFRTCSTWKSLDLSDNRLHGSVPKSLANCTNLQFLNLKSNNFKDRFPYWLGALPLLQVLDLSSNKFYGHITNSEVDNPFPLLQIIDLSNNNFSGKITTTFKAMLKIDGSSGPLQYLGPGYSPRFSYSITLTVKGLERKYVKIFRKLFAFDLSNNAFEGEIPNSIGDLVSICGLNLSHNQLTGPIPTSISKLTSLESLDLSHNKLTGRIPQELSSLTFLAIFDASDNQLVGPIPQGNNFNTFKEDSYLGNLGLCGFPLPQCREDYKPMTMPPTRGSEDEGILTEWKVVMMGYACGTVVGMAWGYYMVFITEPFWIVKCVTMVELAIVKLFVKRGARRGRR